MHKNALWFTKAQIHRKTIKRAHVLLRLDNNADVRCAVNELHRFLGISRNTINNILKDYQSQELGQLFVNLRTNVCILNYCS